MSEVQQFRYFSAVQDRLFRRCGTAAFIGATRTATGFVWNVEKITAIPLGEIARNLKTYNNGVRRGDIKERDREEYESQIKPALNVSAEPTPDSTPEQPTAEPETPTDAAPIPKRKRRKSRG